MLVLPLTSQSSTPQAVLSLVGIELLGLFLLLGLWTKGRIKNISFRFVAGLVVIAYASYLIYELCFSGKPLTFEGRSSEASPKKSIVGFIVIGLPCLWFTVFGRFTFSPVPKIADSDHAHQNDEGDKKNG